MQKSQHYYSKDVAYQVELNLQNIRRFLVNLLDECEFHHCLQCNRLKCICSKKSALGSTTVAVASSDSVFPYECDRASKDNHYIVPPANTLPKPRWAENITSKGKAKGASEEVSTISLNNWIRASIPSVTQSTSRVSFPVPRKPLDHVDYSWPPFPKSIWSDEKQEETIARERIFSYEPERDGNSSVEAFFNYEYFSENRAIPGPSSHVDANVKNGLV